MDDKDGRGWCVDSVCLANAAPSPTMIHSKTGLNPMIHEYALDPPNGLGTELNFRFPVV